jgi:hypothetical protein
LPHVPVLSASCNEIFIRDFEFFWALESVSSQYSSTLWCVTLPTIGGAGLSGAVRTIKRETNAPWLTLLTHYPPTPYLLPIHKKPNITILNNHDNIMI